MPRIHLYRVGDGGGKVYRAFVDHDAAGVLDDVCHSDAADLDAGVRVRVAHELVLGAGPIERRRACLAIPPHGIVKQSLNDRHLDLRLEAVHRLGKLGGHAARPMRTYPTTVARIVQELVAIAAKTGKWMPLEAVAALSKEMSVEPPERASEVAAHLIERAKYGHLSGADIKNACSQSGFKGQEDSVISSFKAVGILSPALGYLPGIKRHMGPLYELNPSFSFVQKSVSTSTQGNACLPNAVRQGGNMPFSCIVLTDKTRETWRSKIA